MQNIKDFLSYDQETGIFTWVKRPKYSKIPVGSIAGSTLNSGHIKIQVGCVQYYSHRLAWWFVHGVIPEYSIDHINENPSDNRICNLRLDVNRENTHNRTECNSNNTSGYKGVCWVKRAKKWSAAIAVNGKTIHLGYYDIPEEAHAAYLRSKRENHPFWIEK